MSATSINWFKTRALKYENNLSSVSGHRYPHPNTLGHTSYQSSAHVSTSLHSHHTALWLQGHWLHVPTTRTSYKAYLYSRNESREVFHQMHFPKTPTSNLDLSQPWLDAPTFSNNSWKFGNNFKVDRDSAKTFWWKKYFHQNSVFWCWPL
jgi:hypothetical protein